jgi:putative hemolysin
MNEVLLQAIVILLLILANGVLAMAEIAVVSARKVRLQQRAEEGDQNAGVALELAQNPADFLSTVQIGITLVGVLAGAYGGAMIARKLAGLLRLVPSLEPYADGISLTVVVLTITYLTLVLGELAPKRLALNDPERAAALMAAPMRFLSRLASPIVRLLSASTTAVLHILGVHPTQEPPITEEEIKVLLEQGTQAGVFIEEEQDMVEAVFRLADRRVGSVMTPRTEIAWLDLEDPMQETQKRILGSVYTRFPVCRGDLDRVVGLVQAKDLLPMALKGQPVDLESAIIQPQFVPENMPAFQVLELFRQSRHHIVLVINEFGGLEGLVTTFDILESIVGDIPDIGDIEGPRVIRRGESAWLVDGRLAVDEFKEIFDVSGFPPKERSAYETIGGFVMARLGRIPQESDEFEWQGLRFEVMDMDGFRVDKVLVTKLPAAENGDR